MHILILILRLNQHSSIVARNRIFVEVAALPSLLEYQFLCKIVYVVYWSLDCTTVAKGISTDHTVIAEIAVIYREVAVRLRNGKFALSNCITFRVPYKVTINVDLITGFGEIRSSSKRDEHERVTRRLPNIQ
jgi:hypothetical protein